MPSSIAGLRVAVVDDDPLLRQVLSQALRRLDVVDVDAAEDGASALALLESHPVDVLLCDLNMPGMDGIELLRHLALRRDAPALAMISADDHILRIAGELAQAHHLRLVGTIPKPATTEALRGVLERALETVPGAIDPITPRSPLDPENILCLIPDGIELHFQPQVDPRTGLPVSVEALARLRHPTEGLLGPGMFVPLCEQRGLTFSLTRVVVRRSIEQAGVWRRAGMPVGVSANVTGEDLVDVTVVSRIEAAAQDNGIPMDALTLEVTESRILPESPGPLEVLSRLRMKGVGLSIDDFGTGFSTLQQLRRIPFHELKIDQSFVGNATTDEQARTMLSSTVELARELGLSTVAEGVETADQLELVTTLGCDLVQGYHLARPMPVEQATTWLEERLRT